MAHAPQLPPAGSPVSRGALVGRWITGTFSGRAIAFGVAVKLAAWLIVLAAGASVASELIDTIGDLALMAGALVIAWRLYVGVKRRVLWRVRRKLTLSYIFIGFVPALLIIVFFLVSGLLLFFNVASYMVRREIAGLVERTQYLAESAALSVSRARSLDDAADALARRQAAAAARSPGLSMAIVPAARCGAAGPTPRVATPVAAGPWAHAAVPALPDWIPCDGHAGLVAVPGDSAGVVARAVVWPEGGGQAVVVDVPVDQAFVEDLRGETTVTLGEMTAVAAIAEREDVPPAEPVPPSRILIGPANLALGDDAEATLNWVTFVGHVDWESGAERPLVVSFRMGLRGVYDRISAVPVASVGDLDLGEILLWAMAIIGGLFLVIQVVAFGMGLALARSITGSVHELFAGTERVRQGDFTGRIAIGSRDQLGELAESFNSMTASIEDLLQQKAVKERLEQELRIAREIQMSLLPHGALTMPGVSLTAHCEPAREVGGDYYDFLPIDDHTLGILIADVSGKGTSAALYMAELKGIVLSLCQRHTSPRDLLIEADRIISRHLDSRSFITVTYLVVDLAARVVRYARAGHCPLIYVPGPYAASRAPRLVTPDGLVLGLQLDEGRTFARLLEEVSLPLGPGDLFLLYTDGLSEAMNPQGDCFGDARLADLVGAHPDAPAAELRERILRDIAAFAESAPQHDDMTMVVLRVEEVAGGLAAVPANVHGATT